MTTSCDGDHDDPDFAMTRSSSRMSGALASSAVIIVCAHGGKASLSPVPHCAAPSVRMAGRQAFPQCHIAQRRKVKPISAWARCCLLASGEQCNACAWNLQPRYGLFSTCVYIYCCCCCSCSAAHRVAAALPKHTKTLPKHTKFCPCFSSCSCSCSCANGRCGT